VASQPRERILGLRVDQSMQKHVDDNTLHRAGTVAGAGTRRRTPILLER
jgi:hypothetical protein